MDEGKQPILVFRFAAAQLVNEHGFRLPDRGWGLDIADRRAIVVGEGKPDKVIEGNQAGVVVAVRQAERFAEAVEEESFPRAGLADEQQRVAGNEGREDNVFHGIVAVDPELAQPAGSKQASVAGQRRTEEEGGR